MSARPIIPGRFYAVRYRGSVVVVCAPHPCDALMDVFNLMFRETQ